jgi:hypothetical protein
MPTASTNADGSACSAAPCIGMEATTIQSTSASRPSRAAVSWDTRVDQVLVTRPRIAAAIQSRRSSAGPRLIDAG